MEDFAFEQPPELPPFGADQILIVEDFIDRELCKRICDHIEASYQRQPVTEFKNHRTAYQSPLGNWRPKLREIFYDALNSHIIPFFKADIEWWELPQLLRYAKGGRYDPHADAENWQRNAPEPYWLRVHDRDISLLLYLNADFTGGKLNFPRQNLKLTPKPGLLVAFPSHHGYQHGAEPTEDGLRYVIVSWAAIRGTERVVVKPPEGRIFMEEFKA